jgi:hypothetical protein
MWQAWDSKHTWSLVTLSFLVQNVETVNRVTSDQCTLMWILWMLIAQMPHRICFAIQCLQSNGKNGNLAPRNDVSLQVSTWTSIVSVAFDCYRFTVNSVQFCIYLQQFGKDLVCVKHALWQTSTASCSIPWRPSTQDSKPVYREATATIHFPHHCAEGWIEKR